MLFLLVFPQEQPVSMWQLQRQETYFEAFLESRVGGGAPSNPSDDLFQDIRLGDVIVSNPQASR